MGSTAVLQSRHVLHRRIRRRRRRLFHAYLICSQLVCCSNYLICSPDVLCSADVVSKNAVIPSTANDHREESVFERGEQQRGGEAKEEKIKEDQQEEKVSNELYYSFILSFQCLSSGP